MPNYLTDNVAAGDLSLKNFITTYIAESGFLGNQRLNDLYQVDDTHYQKAIEKVETDLDEVNKWDESTSQQKADEYYQINLNQYYLLIGRTAPQRHRLQRMFSKLEEWKVPSAEHQQLKTAMRRALLDAIDDLDDPPPPTRLTGKQYKSWLIERYHVSLDYLKDAYHEELEVQVQKNRYRALLKKALEQLED